MDRQSNLLRRPALACLRPRMRWEFGAEMTDQFSPFVAIDSETDDLPVGAVRNLWDADTLTRKDLEISRCEQLYRAQCLEACSRLIERLQSNQD